MAMKPTEQIPAWDHPIVLGKRLCWFDGERNRVVPILSVRSLWTNEQQYDLENGYHATLPTENGATVDVTYDPGHESTLTDDESRVTQWLYVTHPEYGYLIDAAVKDDAIVYDPGCRGAICEACDHSPGHWWEYVFNVDQIMRNLAWLGSLPIKAVWR